MKLKFYLSLGAVILFTLSSVWWLRSSSAPGTISAPMYLAMATDREAGSFLEVHDLVWRARQGPANEQSSLQYFAKGAVKPEHLIGSVLRVPLKTGQFIDAPSVVSLGDSAFLSAVLKPGSRAIAVPIDRISGSSGLIQPGNYVDVILARQALPGSEKGAAVAQTMVSNVRVIAINQKIESGLPISPASSAVAQASIQEGNLDRGTATLEVSPRQAELLATMRNAGDLSLSLRSLIAQGDTEHNAHDVEALPATQDYVSAQPPAQVVQLLGTERHSDSSAIRSPSY